MNVEIRDSTGKVRLFMVAKTKRGFNKQQRKRIVDTRLQIAQESGLHLSGEKHCDKCITSAEIGGTYNGVR